MNVGLPVVSLHSWGLDGDRVQDAAASNGGDDNRDDEVAEHFFNLLKLLLEVVYFHGHSDHADRAVADWGERG